MSISSSGVSGGGDRPLQGVVPQLTTAEGILDNLEELTSSGAFSPRIFSVTHKMTDPNAQRTNIDYALMSTSEDLAERSKDPDKLKSMKRRVFSDQKAQGTSENAALDLRNNPADIKQQKEIKERAQKQGEQDLANVDQQLEREQIREEQERRTALASAAALGLNKEEGKDDSSDGMGLIGRSPKNRDGKENKTSSKQAEKAASKQAQKENKEKKSSKKEKNTSLMARFSKVLGTQDKEGDEEHPDSEHQNDDDSDSPKRN